MEIIKIYRKGPNDMGRKLVHETNYLISLAEWVSENGRFASGFELISVADAIAEFESSISSVEGAIKVEGDPEGEYKKEAEYYKQEIVSLEKARKQGYTYVVTEDGDQEYGFYEVTGRFFNDDDEELIVGDAEHTTVVYSMERETEIEE